MMFQNKLVYEAYQLIANDNGAYEEAFIRRIKEIDDAVEERNDVKIQFLAESLIGDYGTHVVNKATAAAEIQQQTFIDRIEKFKGESSMQKTKSEGSVEFANIAELSIGYESKHEKKEKHSIAKLE